MAYSDRDPEDKNATAGETFTGQHTVTGNLPPQGYAQLGPKLRRQEEEASKQAYPWCQRIILRMQQQKASTVELPL